MEPLSCKSAANCRACEHFEAGVGCALELDVELALQALAAQARPRIPVRSHARGVLVAPRARA